MIYARFATVWNCGPELLLRVHNRRDIESDIFGACIIGDVHLLKQCLVAKIGSVFDVDDHTGSSLLDVSQPTKDLARS